MQLPGVILPLSDTSFSTAPRNLSAAPPSENTLSKAANYEEKFNYSSDNHTSRKELPVRSAS